MKHLLYFFSVLWICFSLSEKAKAEGHSVENGGDLVIKEFSEIGYKTVCALQTSYFAEQNPNLLSKYRLALKEAKLKTQEFVFLDGVEVVATNRPQVVEITINKNYWLRLKLEDKFLMVLHEFLWLSGANDTNFKLSLNLIKIAFNPNCAYP